MKIRFFKKSAHTKKRKNKLLLFFNQRENKNKEKLQETKLNKTFYLNRDIKSLKVLNTALARFNSSSAFC